MMWSTVIYLFLFLFGVAYVSHAIGYVKGYKAGMENGGNALKEYHEHVIKSIRFITG